jgi:hypothetical protein
MKHEKQLNEIHDKLSLYASFTFDLKRLREINWTSPPPEQHKLDKIAEDIGSLIRPKFYLLGPKVIREWLEVNKDYRNQNSIRDLIEALREEYNTEIRAKYREFIGFDLPILED